MLVVKSIKSPHMPEKLAEAWGWSGSSTASVAVWSNSSGRTDRGLYYINVTCSDPVSLRGPGQGMLLNFISRLRTHSRRQTVVDGPWPSLIVH